MFDFRMDWEGDLLEDGDAELLGGVGGRFSDLLARGDLPRLSLLPRTVRSMGARGEAGEDRRDLPTEPMGEQVISLDLVGELGGRMDAFLRSLGVMGDLIGVCCLSVDGAGGCLVRGDGCRGE